MIDESFEKKLEFSINLIKAVMI